ncbi:MAG TPA: BON domain-containing protein [Gemmatimonadaceae bacterium]|nr:BON domain-containing protein [Gemmatimonadaceae bacterium]
MADDYDNTEDIANMTDGELKTYVLAELRSQKTIDVGDITVRVSDGSVCLEGRVGTEEELRIIDHVITDVIGLKEIDNQLVVDETRRAESPEPIDEHLADEEEHSRLILGDTVLPLSPEAEHLGDPMEIERDLVSEGVADVTSLQDEDEGTRDVQAAIAEAEPWIPPEGPTPEGVAGEEEGRFGIDGQH